MFCSICTHPKQVEILEDYIYSGSLRKTAIRYDVGYQSLRRHIDCCIASIYSEFEEQEFNLQLRKFHEYLRIFFAHPQRKRKKRPKSIIKKPVEFTWSRRGWKQKKDKNT